MLTFKNFSGINNVQPGERLGSGELSVARNVDAGLSGELRRRSGYARVSTDAHTNLFRAPDFLLATVGLNGDLTNVDSGTVLFPSLGHDRVWYLTLPDKRVAFTNGLISGVTNGLTSTDFGVRVPHAVGALSEIDGDLHPGEYRYQITYVRLSDGLEGGAAYSAPYSVTSGGVFLSGLPELAGHRINVYLSDVDGAQAFFVGSTTNDLFSFTGGNASLTLPCRTDFVQPAPSGRCLAFWRSRALVAVGAVLYASRANSWETFDVRRDFKQFEAPITSIVGVDDGLYVGTETELAFLYGTSWESLQYRRVVDGPVVLGSGVPVRGELLKQGEGAGLGSAAVFIADRRIVAAFNGGSVLRLTEGRYEAGVTEVAASFRMANGVPQYVAVPR